MGSKEGLEKTMNSFLHYWLLRADIFLSIEAGRPLTKDVL
jgi:hypothetical protein